MDWELVTSGSCEMQRADEHSRRHDEMFKFWLVVQPLDPGTGLGVK